MDEIRACLQSKQFSTVALLCAEAELCDATSNSSDSFAFPLNALHMLSLVLEGNMNEARFLWKRSPPSAKDDPVFVAAWAVARAMWTNDFAAAQRALCSPHLRESPEIRLAAEACQDSLLHRAASLVSSAFASLPLERASQLLGLPPSASASGASAPPGDGQRSDSASTVMAILGPHGWAYDAKSALLTRKPGLPAPRFAAEGRAGGPQQQREDAGDGIGLQLEQLTEFVFHLEH